MKRVTIIVALLGFNLVIAEPERSPARPGNPPANGLGFRNRPGAPAAGVDGWMGGLEQRNPELFRRLQDMRQTDPESFRRALREQLRAEWMARAERERPAVARAVRGLSDEDRDWLFGRLTGGGEAPWNRGGRMREPGERPDLDERPADDSEFQAEIMNHVRAIRDSEDDASKAVARQSLRASLERSYASKQEHRRAQLDKFETKLKQMREELEARSNRSKEAIDAKMIELEQSPEKP